MLRRRNVAARQRSVGLHRSQSWVMLLVATGVGVTLLGRWLWVSIIAALADFHSDFDI